MPRFLKVRLKEEELHYLLELKQKPWTPPRTRNRIEVILLSSRGLTVKKIAEYLKQKESTVRKTLVKWLTEDKESLFDRARSGRPKKWEEEDWEYLEHCLKTEERTYNSQQLSELLKEKRNVELSSERIRKILKKKDYKWKRTKISLKGKQKASEKTRKKIDLETLKLCLAEGGIKIKYLDEAGFDLNSSSGYSWIKRGEQKEIKQKKRGSKRLSILGLFEENGSFEYGLKLGSFKSEHYIKMMDWQAEKAEKYLKETGKITVIVLDNYIVHRSQEVKKHEEKWREKGLEFFFISAYSPELNIIETEWHQLKNHEICGRMFDDLYDLSMAVIEGIEKRSIKNNRECERFKFNQSSSL